VLAEPIIKILENIMSEKIGDIKTLIYDMIKICHSYRYSIHEEECFRAIIRHLADDLYSMEVEVAKIRQGMADSVPAKAKETNHAR